MWVCAECGLKHGTQSPVCATWHEDTCEVCGTVGPVTEARDFGARFTADVKFTSTVNCEDALDAADAREALAEAQAHGTISLADLLAKHATGMSSIRDEDV